MAPRTRSPRRGGLRRIEAAHSEEGLLAANAVLPVGMALEIRYFVVCESRRACLRPERSPYDTDSGY